MAKNEYKVVETGCHVCEHYKDIGGTRYCGGFNKRRNPKRFSSSDPKVKAPKWCPKRLDPPAVRVYRYKDERARYFGEMYNTLYSKENPAFVHPMGHHYRLVFETRASVTVASLQEPSGFTDLSDACDFTLESSDVIEVDSGLAVHQFFCKDKMLVPAYFTPPDSE